jgi:hypothetical protein
MQVNNRKRSTPKLVKQQTSARVLHKLPTVMGTKQSTGTVFKAASRIFEGYVSRCDISITAEDVKQYILTDINIPVIDCVLLQSPNITNRYYNSFKVKINYNDKDKFLCPSLWLEGVIINKFIHPRRNTGN